MHVFDEAYSFSPGYAQGVCFPLPCNGKHTPRTLHCNVKHNTRCFIRGLCPLETWTIAVDIITLFNPY